MTKYQNIECCQSTGCNANAFDSLHYLESYLYTKFFDQNSKQSRMTTYFKDVTQENEGNDLSRSFDMNLNKILIVDETTYIICSSCDVKSEADLNLLEIIISPL